jgi:signal peptidase II
MHTRNTLDIKRTPFSTSQTAVWYIGVTLGAALVDWGSKLVAIRQLTDNTVMFGSRFALMLVYNPGGAGGVSWGPHTWLINVCLTAFSVLIISGIVAQLAKIDRRAAIALGLVAGGAVGNLLTMVSDPRGVADFLAFRSGERAIICNVADLSLWSGALLLLPVVRSLILAIRLEQHAKAAAQPGLYAGA